LGKVGLSKKEKEEKVFLVSLFFWKGLVWRGRRACSHCLRSRGGRGKRASRRKTESIPGIVCKRRKRKLVEKSGESVDKRKDVLYTNRARDLLRSGNRKKGLALGGGVTEVTRRMLQERGKNSTRKRKCCKVSVLFLPRKNSLLGNRRKKVPIHEEKHVEKND